MIRNDELLNKLIADLHFHNYINFVDDNTVNSKGDITITNLKKQVILNYIDDVYIDYFFRKHVFKPIIVPKGFIPEKYTDKGKVRIDSELSLCLNNIYDRYTFIDFIFLNFGLNSDFIKQCFYPNTFFHNLCVDEKRHGATGLCNYITSYVRGCEYDTFLNSDDYKTFRIIDKHMQKDFAIEARAALLMKFNKYRNENLYKFKFDGFSNIGINTICNIHRDYIKIKDSHLFGDYTIEEILLIYSLLVEKFKFYEDKISTFVSMFVDPEVIKNNIVGQFNKFESTNIDYKIIEPYIFIEDLYLRFTNPNKSKAFKIKAIDNIFLEIQLFNRKSIKSVYSNNSLPLPYLYNSLYNNN